MEVRPPKTTTVSVYRLLDNGDFSHLQEFLDLFRENYILNIEYIFQ